MMIVKRNGQVSNFDAIRIKNAIKKAITATQANVQDEKVNQIVEDINTEIRGRFHDFFPNVENVQDIVEKHLVKNDLYDVAKAYIIYRADREKEREQKKQETMQKSLLGKLTVKKSDGTTVIFDLKKLHATIDRVSKGHEKYIKPELISQEVIKNIYDGVSSDEIEKALILATSSFIEKDPSYSFVASKLFMQKLCKEVMQKSIKEEELFDEYKQAFINGIQEGVKEKLLDTKMLEFDLKQLSEKLRIDRDELLQYMGIQTLYERYFLKSNGKRLELPQSFWMRVAMGLSLNEEKKNEKAIEFYNLISQLRFVPSTPTLFHSGTTHPQLSSCYLTTISDDLKHIFKCLGDNAQLSKWSGGIGNDWTNIRSTGASINSTGVNSQGVIPFLKIANDVTAAINRSGKRRGATVAYLETWHLDIEDFIELRKNTGDERRRTHDMNISNWIPDLFMKRVLNDENWTLFSPDETLELHEIYGAEFEKKYIEYEAKARNGEIKKHKVISATKMWRKMLSMLFETGHPWITFKDPCNIRSPQDHKGVIHSSNLCTEITLNTSADETAVCNLGSVNLTKHVTNGEIDKAKIAETVKIAIRMLDNVIDVNYYPTTEAHNSNMRHRPIGLGVMGFQDMLYRIDVAFDSPKAIETADNVQELIAYNAILGSSELAKERGKYESYEGSKWDRGMLPQDTIDLLEKENIKVISSQPERTNSKYQILGCDIYHGNYKLKIDVDAFLYIGDGKFHPRAILYSEDDSKTNREVIMFNPISNTMEILDKKEIQRVLKKEQANKTRFLAADNVGVVVTTKPGQEHL
ncbi:ribonucleoside-diphosphate reductase subunit alpha, partial [archaeon]|nr:ribonucleoside-diphosphate reductase subunit alpha [archaeon]